MRNSASKYLIQREKDGLSPIPVSFHQAGVPLPASLLTQRVCSSTISTSDANDPMAIISMLFLFVKQLAFIVARSLKTAQERVVTDAQSFFRAFPPTLPGIAPMLNPPLAAHGGYANQVHSVAARTPCHAARVLCHASKSSEYAKSRPFYATSGFLIYAVFTPFQASDC